MSQGSPLRMKMAKGHKAADVSEQADKGRASSVYLLGRRPSAAVHLQRSHIMKARIVLALALILIMAGSAPVAAGGATVPFHADMRTSCVEIWDFDTLIVTLDCSGEGEATHLGRSTLESITYVFLVSYETPPPWVQLGGVTLIAADGDRLELYVEGVVGTGADGGRWEVVEGGTGRFGGMMGSGAYGTVPDGKGGWRLHFEGTLTKPE
jgi:hypothetical protein